ncbi:ATP-dependent transcriptional regulator [Brevibacillus humidisoli]|uniref:BTAD domain-containing putative transcriptional regulator n=1 Tax=Brevibacillus humidisoli TaxID=2895522 RepID=UPI001E39C349|nr:BTAD domain-containing putative transcriptional regulator [Brevibacillus humidisoli]UFJ43099.1 ATP-dependent transcriptional regulator [Brevibacillus humidisoli]
METPPILLTKLTPPRLKPHLLRRPALVRKLRYMLINPLSLLHGGSGSGKSTSLASFLHDEKIPTCWYNIDRADDRLSVFLRYIVESVRLHHPVFGRELLQMVEACEDPPEYLPEQVEALAFQFLNDLTRLPDELVLVLDDFHHVQASPCIDRWMEQVTHHLPHNSRLVLITRDLPVWPALSSMRIRGDCWELGPEDLAFTLEETEAFMYDELELELSAQDVKRLHQMGEGWIMMLRLLGERLAMGEPLSTVLDPSAGPLRELRQYLLQAVYDQESPQLKQFLSKTAVLDELTPEAVSRLAGADAESMLAEAIRRNLYLYRQKDGSYRYLRLFREVLLEQLRLQPAVFQENCCAAAAYYQGRGDIVTALHYLHQVQEWEQIGQLLTRYGGKWLEEGRLDLLYEWVTLLPDEVKDRHYTLWYFQAEVERYRCLYPQALSSYDRYITSSAEQNDTVGRCLGLEGKARVHLDSVQGLKAEELLKQAIKLLDNQDHELAPRLYRLLAEIYTNRGNAAEAEHWYRRSQDLERQTEVDIESRLFFRTGRLQSALRLLEKKWQEEKVQGMSHLTRSYKETSLLLAFVCGLNGEREKGISYAETAIQLGKAALSPFVEACGYVRKAHCMMLDQTYDAHEVRHLYLKGLHMMDELQSTRGKAESLLGLTLFYGREKTLDLALAYGQRGLDETQSIKDDWLNGFIRLGIGMAYAYSGKFRMAEPVFRQCVDRFADCGDGFGMAISHLWLGYLAYREANWQPFVSAMRLGLSAIRSGEYDFLLQRPTMFTPSDVQSLMPLLVEAQKRQVDPEYVTHLLQNRGLHNISFHPGYTLRIQTLGQFRVWLGDQELSEKAWQRGKAKQLFKLLLTKRHQLLAREEIFRHIWAESDEETASRDFKVALNALVKALEPNREARSHSFFIQRQGSAYGFHLASGCQIDAEEFERLVSAGLTDPNAEKAAALLEKGLAYYNGEYLPTCRYDDWCIEERERLHVLYLRSAEKLAQSYVALKRYDDSIRWCESILREDDCWEEAYRLLMYCYYRKNNRAQSLKWYKKCVQKLREQLGVEPLPSTRDTYQLIMESGRT